MTERFKPIFELTRGKITESIHYGAIAVVDSHGKLLFSYGDPQTVAFLRSSAKPFQALPFFERGGPKAFNLSPKEKALICASHEGSDEHVRVAESIQAKTGIKESDLQCGIHMPGDAAAYKALIASGEAPTPNRNNCSGKHSGMLAHAKMRGLALDTYLDIHHPIQQDILTGFAEMCDYPKDKVEVGIDGCSAPNFAVPLYNSALAFARLCDPQGIQNASLLTRSSDAFNPGLETPKNEYGQGRTPRPYSFFGETSNGAMSSYQNSKEARAKACQEITEAMTSHPEMVSGYNEFDCRLMQAGKGQIVCKRGAEGFQAIGLLPGVVGVDSPGIGITFKVSDGDPSFRKLDIVPHNRVRPAVTLEILRQIGALSEEQTKELAEFGPALPVKNHRGIVVGESRPVFQLENIIA